MTLRRCEWCGHIWKDRVTFKKRQSERCPKCAITLTLKIKSRLKFYIPTIWLKEQIRETVEELDALEWNTESEGRRNKLHGRLEFLKKVENTFIAEEEPLDIEELSILNASPEALATILSEGEKKGGRN